MNPILINFFLTLFHFFPSLKGPLHVILACVCRFCKGMTLQSLEHISNNHIQNDDHKIAIFGEKWVLFRVFRSKGKWMEPADFRQENNVLKWKHKRRYRIRPVRRSVTEFSSKMRVFPGKKLSRFRGMKGIHTHQVTLMVVSELLICYRKDVLCIIRSRLGA